MLWATRVDNGRTGETRVLNVAVRRPLLWRRAGRLGALAAAVLAAVPLLGVMPATAGGVPANDNFADAEVLAGDAGTIVGSNVGATAEIGERNHLGFIGEFKEPLGPNATIWYEWTPSVSGVATFDTFGSDFDTVIAGYQATAVDSLGPALASNDDSDGLQSLISFGVKGGETYQIVVDGFSPGAVGSITLNYEVGPPPNDDFADAQDLAGDAGTVSGSNLGATAETGEPSHAGLGPNVSVWYEWTPSVSGIATFDSFGSDFDTMLAAYQGTAVDALGAALASNDDTNGLQSMISFEVTSGETYDIVVDGFSSAMGNITLTYTVAPPPNDNFANAELLAVNTGTVSGSNIRATAEVDEPAHGAFGPTASVWYEWTPTVSGLARIDTFGSDFDTLLAAYQGTAVDALGAALASNDDTNGLQSMISFEVTSGQKYRIVVDGFFTGATGNIVLNFGLTFADISGNTHEESIEKIVAAGISLGCDATGTLYCPADQVTRGQMASLLARGFNLPPATGDHFADDDGTTHEENVNRIFEAGVTTGFTDGTFRPEGVVSRAQMGSFLARAMALAPIPGDVFLDVSGVHEANINAIAAAGVTLGCTADGTLYCPDDPVRRDQMASFIARALGL